MQTTATGHSSITSNASSQLSTWKKWTLTALVVNALLLLLLVAVIMPFVSKAPVEPLPIFVVIVDFALATLLFRVRAAWPSLAAAIFLIFAFAGAIPHDFPMLIHPDNAGHVVFSVLNFGVAAFGIVAGFQSYRVDRGVLAAK